MFVLYKPVVFLHIFFGFMYMLAHGASVSVAYRLRQESSLERVRTLLDLSGSSLAFMYLSLLFMFLGGIALGFLGHWWSSRWIWASLLLLIAILVFMWLVASKYFHRVRRAVGLPYLKGSKEQPAEAPVSEEEIRTVLRSGQPHLLTLVGIGGWALILWLMIFKPF